MSEESPIKVTATYGVRCVSNHETSLKVDGGDVSGGYSPSVWDAFPAALPYFGAAVGLLAGQIIVWLLQSAQNP